MTSAPRTASCRLLKPSHFPLPFKLFFFFLCPPHLFLQVSMLPSRWKPHSTAANTPARPCRNERRIWGVVTLALRRCRPSNIVETRHEVKGLSLTPSTSSSMPPRSAIPELQRASTSLPVRVSASRPAPLPGHSVTTSPPESVDPVRSQTSEHAAPRNFLLSEEHKCSISDVDFRPPCSDNGFICEILGHKMRILPMLSAHMVSPRSTAPTVSPTARQALAALHLQKIINPLAPRLTPEVNNIAAHHPPTPIQSNGIILPYSASLDLLTHHRRGIHLPTP